MATATVDLTSVSVLTEIVVRAGNARQPDARYILQAAYPAVWLPACSKVGNLHGLPLIAPVPIHGFDQ